KAEPGILKPSPSRDGVDGRGGGVACQRRSVGAESHHCNNHHCDEMWFHIGSVCFHSGLISMVSFTAVLTVKRPPVADSAALPLRTSWTFFPGQGFCTVQG